MLSKLIQSIKMPSEGHLDSPETTARRKAIILSKPFLYSFYRGCYSFFEKSSKNTPKGIRLEIGSGAGFLQEYVSGVLRSDILSLPELDLTCSAQNLPFKKNTLSAIYMLNVFHHIQDVTHFLNEALRCIMPGGMIAMVEPASTFWSRFIYRNFHDEEFNTDQKTWKLPNGGPLTTANGALPWIVLDRDRDIFKEKFPEFIIEKIEYASPFTYLLSGGFSYREFLPGVLHPLVRTLEQILFPLNKGIGLFMRVKLHRKI